MKEFDHIPWLQDLILSSEKIIHEIFENTGSADIKDLLKRQHNGGKRLRPMVIAASAQLGEKSSEQLPYAASAVELFHLASLFHDDVLDDTLMRRDQLASPKKIGNLRSVLSGDYLLAESIELTVKYLPKEIAHYFLTTIKTMVRSEIISHKLLFNTEITRKEYLDIIASKTAVLFELACSIGIRLTTGNSDRIQRLTHFGHQLGMAYQLVDDLEDMMGLIEGGDNDLAHGYMSLPVIELFKSAPAEDKARITKILQTPGDPHELLHWMKSFSIFRTITADIKRYIDEAKKELRLPLQNDEQKIATAMLETLCDYVLNKGIDVIRKYEVLEEEKETTPRKELVFA